MSSMMADYLVNYQVPQQFAKWIETSKSPEETFFATMMRTRPKTYDEIVIDHNSTHDQMMGGLHSLLYAERTNKKCKGKMIHSICIFSTLDLWKLYQLEGNGTKGPLIFNNFRLSVDKVAPVSFFRHVDILC